MRLLHGTHWEEADKILRKGFVIPRYPGELGKAIYTVPDTQGGILHLQPFLFAFRWRTVLELEVDLKPWEVVLVDYGDFDNPPYRPTQPAGRLFDWTEVALYDLGRIKSVRRLTRLEWKLRRLKYPPFPPPRL